MSKKLKRAKAEIEAILKKYDIGAVVTLHTPGHAEYFANLSPSYSAVQSVVTPEGPGYRVRANAAELGSREIADKRIADTANMLNLLATVTGARSLDILDLSEKVDEMAGANHYEPVVAGREKKAEPEVEEKHMLDYDEFQFTATARTTLQHTQGNDYSKHVRSDFYFEVAGRIDAKMYVTPDRMPTKVGVKPMSIALADGIVGNIHYAHENKMWDSAEHLRYVIDHLTRGFATVAHVFPGTF